MIQFPPFLQPGDTIGITCPAGYMALEKTAACIQALKEWGYKVVVGATVGSASENYFSGTDEERREDLQKMLDNKNIHAILFGRGGYGMGRIIDDLDLKKFKKRPKWLIGFSDITVMHNHLLAKHRIASIHGPMAGLFNDAEALPSIESLRLLLNGKKQVITVPADPRNKTGKGTGLLVGGNLALLCNSIGTSSDVKTSERILFIEDIGEYIYSLDRMFSQLHRSGKFKNLSGLILGGFTDMKDTERRFGKSVEDVLQEWAEKVDCPVAFNFPVSHGSNNFALVSGGHYQLKVTKKKTTLKLL